MESAVAYAASQMERFLRKNDPVLICFDADQPGSLGSIFRDAAVRCGAKVTVWGDDKRWKTLLRQCFQCRAGVLIAPPLIVLGLTKLARAKGTPLYLRNVLTAGYACPDWMIDGIRAGLDCGTWGCLDVAHPLKIAGFSCGTARGLHVRSDAFEVQILDPSGKPAAPGQRGRLYLRDKVNDVLIDSGELAVIEPCGCRCGKDGPVLSELGTSDCEEAVLLDLWEQICRWTSVLDCRIQKGSAGLEIEIIAFPGEKLPKLPSCARLVMRYWDPESDAPFTFRAKKGGSI